MSVIIRLATPADSDILWSMLFYAAHMDREIDRTPADAERDPFLRAYVTEWGRPSDLGFIAQLAVTPVGAVWSRVMAVDRPLTDLASHAHALPDIPELAVAVVPGCQGQGIGTRLLEAFLIHAAARFPAVKLTVRADNPAFQLYQRLGFVTTGTLTNRVGTQSYAMIYDLTSLTR